MACVRRGAPKQATVISYRGRYSTGGVVTRQMTDPPVQFGERGDTRVPPYGTELRSHAQAPPTLPFTTASVPSSGANGRAGTGCFLRSRRRVPAGTGVFKFLGGRGRLALGSGKFLEPARQRTRASQKFGTRARPRAARRKNFSAPVPAGTRVRRSSAGASQQGHVCFSAWVVKDRRDVQYRPYLAHPRGQHA